MWSSPGRRCDTRRVGDTSGFQAAEFRLVLGHFPTGVVVVTARTASGPVGLSVNSFTAVSLDPPLVSFCADRRSTSWARIRSAGAFCVNILAEDQEALSRVFARRGADRFDGVGWTPAPSGAPRLDGVLGWVDCAVEVVHDGGDHEICVGRVHDLDVTEGDGPLVFYRGGYGRFEA